MKKGLLFILAAVSILCLLLCLAACKGKGESLPKTDYEKVSFAFQGVERSLRDVGKSNDAADNSVFSVPRLLAGEGDPLLSIRGIYEAGDDQGDVIDGLAFDQPPMIQFQCLKSVLEKVGGDFRFGVRYYDDMTGEVFFDPETGKDKSASADKNDYKFDYDFRLSLRINLDDDDLITADVSFEIKLTRGNEEINTHWYVKMILDYDMASATPIYTLEMRTANDERELTHIGGYVCEYDFVNMKESGIDEWRKFVLESDTELIKDASHPDFASYRSAGVAFNADTCKWYYDRSLKKITRYDEEKGARIADAFFDFGLNATAINGTDFVNLNGVRSDAIKTAYGDFCAAFRKDVIYSLVTKRDEERQGENEGYDNAVGVSVRTLDGTIWPDRALEKDATLRDLLKKDEPWGQGIGYENMRPYLFTVDENGRAVARIERDWTDEYHYTVTVGSETAAIGLSDLLSKPIIEGLGGIETLEENDFLITVRMTNKTNPNYTTSFVIRITYREVFDAAAKKVFPAILSELGMPEYETENGSFDLDDYKEGQTSFALLISGSNNSERSAYLSKLGTEGFVRDQFNDLVKTIGQDVLKINVRDFNQDDLTVTVRREKNGSPTYSATYPAETVANWVEGKFTIPTPTSTKTLLYCYDAANKYIYVCGMDLFEPYTYLARFSEMADTKINYTERTVTTYYEGRFYTISFNVEESGALLLSLNMQEQTPQITLSVNGGTAQPFWPDGGFYTATVKLAPNDAFTISSNPGLLEDGDQYFDLNTETRAYTVKTGGTYTFTGDGGILRVTKN